MYNQHAIERHRWIDAVAGLGPERTGKHPNAFVVPNGVRADTYCFRQSAGAQRFAARLFHPDTVSTLECIPESRDIFQPWSNLRCFRGLSAFPIFCPLSQYTVVPQRKEVWKCFPEFLSGRVSHFL